MFEIKENRRVLPDGTEITTYSRDVISANILEVEAGTTGYKGGDTGHGGRTYFRISPQMIERYAMASARWIQCEAATSEFGFLAKHPTTGAAIQSPYVAIADKYMTQSNRIWGEIFQIVRENCMTEYGGISPQDDVMERLLTARKGN